MKASNGAIRTETQFSVFLANKPNILARVLQRLANEKVNIMALSMMDAGEHGVLRIVVANAAQTRTALQDINVPSAETTVLVTELPNRPGAMADVIERLASSHIGVNYAYCTTGTTNGHAMGVLRVSDFAKASQVLAERKPRRRKVEVVRAAARPRRG